MRTIRTLQIILLSAVVLGALLAQAGPVGAGEGKSIEALTDRIAALEDFIKQATFENIYIKDPGSQALIALVADQGRPNILIFDKGGTKKMEIGLSSLIEDSLITLYGQDEAKNVYVWNGSTVPSRIDWAVMALNAETNTSGYLTEKLVKTAMVSSCRWISETGKYAVRLRVTTDTQPVWNSAYLGTGRFSVSDREVRQAYLEAGAYVLGLADSYLKEVLPAGYAVEIEFTIKGFTVGTCCEGQMTLAGE
jgi:hypothetical protein